PTLRLTDPQTAHDEQAIIRSTLLIGVCVVIGVLALFPRFVRRLRSWWPEQVVLAAALAWLGLGPSVLPLAAAAFVRRAGVVDLSAGLVAGMRRPPATPAPANGTPPS